MQHPAVSPLHVAPACRHPLSSVRPYRAGLQTLVWLLVSHLSSCSAWSKARSSERCLSSSASASALATSRAARASAAAAAASSCAEISASRAASA